MIIGSWVDPRQTVQLQSYISNITQHISMCFNPLDTAEECEHGVQLWIQCPHVLITVWLCDFVFVNSVVDSRQTDDGIMERSGGW